MFALYDWVSFLLAQLYKKMFALYDRVSFLLAQLYKKCFQSMTG